MATDPNMQSDSLSVKKVNPAATYKKVVKKPTYMVQKADGSVGEWGRDPNIKDTIDVNNLTKKKPDLSDKAKGLDNTYNRKNY